MGRAELLTREGEQAPKMETKRCRFLLTLALDGTAATRARLDAATDECGRGG